MQSKRSILHKNIMIVKLAKLWDQEEAGMMILTIDNNWES